MSVWKTEEREEKAENLLAFYQDNQTPGNI